MRFLQLGTVLLLLLGTPLAAFGQTGTIRGTVTEADTGDPIPGVNVFIQALSLGAATDPDGVYVINQAPVGVHTVEVRFIGFGSMSQEITVAANQTATLNFRLQIDALSLDEVVVTGTAGQARRREIGNSIGQIDLSQVQEPVGNVDNLLMGRVAGLNVQFATGHPGSGGLIRLRGNNSVAMSNAPLIYIDGIRIRGDAYPKNVPPVGFNGRSSGAVVSPLNDINPADIARVEVIKGAAATTLYGTEAAGGVIQIFTKRGRIGRPSWTFQIDQGFDRMLAYGTELRPYMGLDPFIDLGHRAKYNASVSGGGSGLRYYISGQYSDQTGVLPNSSQEQYQARGNFGFSPLSKMQVNVTTAFSNTAVQNPPGGNNAHGLTLNALRGRASYFGTDWENEDFASELEQLLDFKINTAIDRIISGAEVLYEPIPNFSHKFSMGYDRSAVELRNLRPFGFIRARQGILSVENWTGETLTFEYVGSYNWRLTEAFRTNISVGGQKVSTNAVSVLAYGEDFPPGEPTVSSGAQQLSRETRQRVVNAGFFGQTLFDLKNRYFITLGLRIDGNSAFGEDFGLQSYPKISGSYVVSDESFWPASLGRVKLRAAWGQAGRAPGAFDAVRTWEAVGWGGQVAFEPENVGNPNLAPERTTEFEVGFDAAFFRENVSVDFSWYNARTKDALFRVEQIPSNGFLNTQLENVGEMTNKGVELAVNAQLLNQSNFGLEIGGTVATNHSEITELGGASAFTLPGAGGGRIQLGGPAPGVVGRKILNPDEFADPIFATDENGNTEVRYLHGPNLPTHTIGANISVRLPKGLRLFVRGEYMGGHYISDTASSNVARRGAFTYCDEIMIGGQNAYELIAAGTVDGLTAFQRAACTTSLAGGSGNIFIYPADFFKLRELTLSIPLPVRSIRGVQNATFKVSGRNIFRSLNDDFLLFDPEMAGRRGGANEVERDGARYIDENIPAPSTWTFSLRVVLQ
ncbi:MAG: TonB-dependent receptor [Bacteroidetes bacterium]|nr:TonB-dependent receptor [Bacteroidota bacterium]